MGGVRARRLLRARQPDRDRRREPARPARRDDARLGRDAYAKRAGAFGWHAIEIDGHDVEAIDEALRRGGRAAGPADRDRRAHGQGQGRRGGRGQAGLARQAARRPEAAIAELGGERNIVVEVAKPEAARAAPLRASSGVELPTLRARRKVATRQAYGDALAALGRARRRRRARRRGLELDVRRDLPRSASRPVLRDVHRRAADGRRRGRPPGARAGGPSPRPSPPSSPAPTTSSAWRRSAARTSALRLARRRLDRRGRAVADGARGHRR